jgi:hypothetical protein
MEYFTDVLDRRTGQLVSVSEGDWITLSELGQVCCVGPREVRTILRAMGVVEVEGVAKHQRHRLATWVVQRGWGRRIVRRGAVPFDVVGPQLRAWIADRWDETLSHIASQASAPSIEARRALGVFNSERLHGPLSVQQSVSWLACAFPHLTQTEMAMVLDVTQQLVGKYLSIRGDQLREARKLKEMDMEERMAQRRTHWVNVPPEHRRDW